MPFQVCFYHLIWTTRHREPLISSDIEPLIITTIRNKSKELRSTIHAINAVEDHIHVAVSIALSVAVSDWVKQAKGVSAYEVNSTYPDLPTRFGWQKSYGVLTFGAKQLSLVQQYIEKQKQHHQSGTLEAYLERTEDN
jgi:putative transposase